MAVRSRIAEAYVQVVPAAGGFFSQLSGMVSPAVGAVGNSAGTRFGNLFTKSAKAALNVAKITAGLATAGAAVAAGFAVKGGISRALNIEDAEAKLKALKYSASDISQVSKSAMDAVKGTSFGFDTAMSTAAGSLAAGVKQGDDLTSYLKLVGDAAVVAGADFGEIGYVFNKVSANGKAFTEELNMLADRGIPVFSWLAKEAGVSMGELRKSVSAGEVSSEQFRKAIEKNIGGAATTAAATTRGYFANFGSAMSRLGASMVGGSLAPVKSALQEIIPVIDAITARTSGSAAAFWERVDEVATPAIAAWSKATIKAINSPALAAAFGAFFGYIASATQWTQQMAQTLADSRMAAEFAKIPEHLSAAVQWMSALAQDVAGSPVGQALAQWAADTANWIGHLRPVGDLFASYIIPAVAGIASALGPVWANIAGGFANTFLPAIHDFVEASKPVLATVGEFFTTTLGPALARFAEFAAPILGMLVESRLNLFSSLLPAIGSLMESLRPLGDVLNTMFSNLGEIFITQVLPQIQNVMAVLGDVISTLLPPLMDIISTVLTYAATIIAQLLPPVLEIFGTLLGVVSQLWTSLAPVLAQLLPVITNIIATILPVVSEVLADVLPVIVSLVQTLGKVAGEIFSALLPVLQPVLDIVSMLITSIASLIGPLLNALLPVVEPLVKLVGSLAGIIGPVLVLIAEALKVVLAFVLPALNLMIQGVIGFVGWILSAVGGIADVFTFIITSTGQLIANIWNFIADALNSVQFETPQWMQDLLGIGGTIGFNVAKLEVPKLYTGGNVAGTAEGTLVALGDRHKAETVTDLGTTNDFISSTLALVKSVQANGTAAAQQVIINVTPAPGMDEELLARHIQKLQRRQQRLAQ